MNITLLGGAGSLGQAFIRLLNDNHTLTVVDNNEWAVAAIRDSYPNVRFKLCDMASYSPSGEDVVVILAAYKHVDLGEANPSCFIRNNVTALMDLLGRLKTERVLYISTDKAVEPISVYGYTKALAEALVAEYGGSNARLGNIIGSTGSVIPVWERAIEQKDPIKVTDERMSRYLIEDYEAANQVWHEFLAGKKRIIPKMEAPKRIMDILTEVLKRHGYERPEDYAPGVEIIGMRPGEKLAEKLLWDREEVA